MVWVPSVQSISLCSLVSFFDFEGRKLTGAVGGQVSDKLGGVAGSSSTVALTSGHDGGDEAEASRSDERVLHLE